MRNCVHSCVSRSVCTNYITMDTVKHLWWALNSAGFSVFELQLFQISTHMYFFIEWYIKFGRYRWHRLHSYALNYLSPTVMAQCKALVGKDTLIHTDSWQGHKSHVFFHSFTTLNKYAANDFWALGSTFKDPVWSTFEILSATRIINMSLGYISLVTFPSVHTFQDVRHFGAQPVLTPQLFWMVSTRKKRDDLAFPFGWGRVIKQLKTFAEFALSVPTHCR